MEKQVHLVAVFDPEKFDKEGAEVSCILADFPMKEPANTKGKYVPFDDAPTNALLAAMNISPHRFKALMSKRGRKPHAIEVWENYDLDRIEVQDDHLPICLMEKVGKATLRLPKTHPCFGEDDDNPYFYNDRQLISIEKGGFAIRLDRNILWAVNEVERYIILSGVPDARVLAAKGKALREIIDIPALHDFELPITNAEWEKDGESWVLTFPLRIGKQARS